MKAAKFSIFFFAIVLYVSNVSAGSFFPSPLITADWLSQNLNEQIVFLDARKDLPSFIKDGHIENAVLVDNKKVRVDKIIDGKKLSRMRPNASEFEAFMQKHGINNNSYVVITHPGKTPGQAAGATRLYWHLKTYRFKDVALLDGGNAAWEEALEDLTNEVPAITQGNYKVGDEDRSTVASMADVKEAIKNDKITLIDSRSLRSHIGVDKKSYVFDYGHIPTSRLLYYKLLNPLKGIAKFLSKDSIKDTINSLGIDLTNDTIVYCNSAYEASAVWFVFHELLGLKNTKIYDGSLHQWTQYAENKLVKKLL